MALRKEDGTVLSVAAFKALFTVVATPEATYTAEENIWEDRDQPGCNTSRTCVLKYAAGDVIGDTVYNAPYTGNVPTFVSVLPVTAVIATGASLVITGTNLNEVSSVSVGGNAATALNHVSDTELSCHAPAHAGGAVSIVLTYGGGAVTAAAAVTYA